jgi:TolA-binding protein
MQAVKFITTYFDAHPAPPDEQLLDAMGIALSQADAAGVVKSSLFTDAGKTYKKLNTKLEVTRTGEKRWGPDWLPAADVDTKQSTVNTSQSTVTRNTAQIQKLDGQIAATQKQKDAVLYTEGNNNQTQKKDAFQKQIDELSGQRSTAQKELAEAQKTLADLKPKWPEAVAVSELTLATTASGDATSTSPATPATPDAKPVVQPYHGTRYAAAFAVAPDLLVTASSAVADATDIEIPTSAGQPIKAEVVRADAPSGLTLLRVSGAHFSPLPIAAAAKMGACKCEAFPEVNLFGPMSQELTGSLSVNGEHSTVSLDKLPRLPGGPLLQDGKVVGIEIGDRESDRENIPAVSLELLQPLLASDATGKAVVTDMKNSVFQIAASR